MVVVAIRHPPEDKEAVQDDTVNEISGGVVSAGGVGGDGGGVAPTLVVGVPTPEGVGSVAATCTGDVFPSTIPMPPLLAPAPLLADTAGV